MNRPQTTSDSSSARRGITDAEAKALHRHVEDFAAGRIAELHLLRTKNGRVVFRLHAEAPRVEIHKPTRKP